MSKHGPCHIGLPNCGPRPVAWWNCPNGTHVWLCKKCLDMWFGNADDDESLEPTAWGWIDPPAPSREQLAAALRDPRNREIVAEVLRREARAHPGWLRESIDRENRAHRRVVA